jgi:formylglycine-generating enzyme required for sulfatase activity
VNRLNYHHLLYFWIVAREGTIARACAQLHLTQPTISGQLRSLDRALGAKLFDRLGRNLVLTKIGRVVFRYADEIFSLGRELQQALSGRPAGRPLQLLAGIANAKQPHDRWPSCREFVKELADCNVAERGRRPVGEPTPQVLTNSIGMKLVYVPAGRFLMGSPETEPERHADEGPQHLVAICRPFYIGMFSVTQREYEAVMGDNPSHFKQAIDGGPTYPVESVSWHDAMEFCRKLSSRYEEREACHVYYLPTEAEWEYACRAGTLTPFALGLSLSSLQANFNGKNPYGNAPQGPFRQQTTPVGSFKPNAFGLFDMHGNVWEWCADFYREDYYAESPERDPLGPRSGDRRVLRGGNWNSAGGKNCRSARRGKDDPTSMTQYDGFRVVMIAGGDPQPCAPS